MFGPSVTQQARQEVANRDRRRKVKAKADRIEQSRLNRQAAVRSVFDLILG